LLSVCSCGSNMLHSDSLGGGVWVVVGDLAVLFGVPFV
jgi:hypothetical protein